MVFMFEDNPTTPSSELLCYTFRISIISQEDQTL